MNFRTPLQTTPHSLQRTINFVDTTPPSLSPVERVLQAVEDNFESEQEPILIKDEFSAKFCSKVIRKCRKILASTQDHSKTSLVWVSIDSFLQSEMRKLAHLKEQRDEAAHNCEILTQKTKEALSLPDTDRRFQRVEACQFAFLAQKMLRDNFTQRIDAIVDFFVTKILPEANPCDELRLRACFAKV